MIGHLDLYNQRVTVFLDMYLNLECIRSVNLAPHYLLEEQNVIRE